MKRKLALLAGVLAFTVMCSPLWALPTLAEEIPAAAQNAESAESALAEEPAAILPASEAAESEAANSESQSETAGSEAIGPESLPEPAGSKDEISESTPEAAGSEAAASEVNAGDSAAVQAFPFHDHEHIYEKVITQKASSKTGYGRYEEICTVCGLEGSSGSFAYPYKAVLDSDSSVFNGKPIRPKVTVLDSSNQVIDPSHYTVTYYGQITPASDHASEYAENDKSVGRHYCKITFQSDLYEGTLCSGSYTILPKSTGIESLTPQNKAFSISWQRRSAEVVTGYEIEYSTKNNFPLDDSTKSKLVPRSGTVSATVSKLDMGTRYYVHIRTYKEVGSSTYYSAWSSVKSVVTHSHEYKKISQKATLKKDGYSKEVCSCGAVRNAVQFPHPQTIQLSQKQFTFSGNARRPAVTVTDSSGKAIDASNYTVTYPENSKAVGSHTCKIVFKGNYSGSVTRNFTIVPRGSSIETLTAGHKSFTASWAQRSKEVITGYQVQYYTDSPSSTDAVTKTFRNNLVTSLSCSGLYGNETYHVRIRTYKDVNGTRYFSAWSEEKKVHLEAPICSTDHCTLNDDGSCPMADMHWMYNLDPIYYPFSTALMNRWRKIAKHEDIILPGWGSIDHDPCEQCGGEIVIVGPGPTLGCDNGCW